MADRRQLALLQGKIEDWQRWRQEHPSISPDLSHADLTGADLRGADLSGVNLFNADLRGADLSGADLARSLLMYADLGGARLAAANLRQANLSIARLVQAEATGARFSGAYLNGANLEDATLSTANLFVSYCHDASFKNADLSEADLSGANFSRADLSGARLCGARLGGAVLKDARLIAANLERAQLAGCRIPGLIARDLKLEATDQRDLTISYDYEAEIVVDSLERAQLIWLMRSQRQQARVQAADSLMPHAVLILGHFAHERHHLLDGMRAQLREYGYSPIFLNLEREDSNLEAIVACLLELAWFVIVDCTEPELLPAEIKVALLAHAVAVLPLVPDSFGPGEKHPDLGQYPWVLPPLCYQSPGQLLAAFAGQAIEPAARLAGQLARLKGSAASGS